MSPSATTNYAELVLQEAAAEKLKQTSAPTAHEVTSSVVKLNLEDQETFPALGKAIKKNSVAWGSVSDSAAPLKSAPPSLLQPKAATTTTGTISCAFQLPAEQQRRSIASISLAECLQRVMKQTEAVVEACTSGQSKAISFVIRGSQQQVTLAKRMIWSELAQNGSIEFEVPQEALKFIIGPAGRTLQSLQHQLAVRIQIPKAADWQGTLTVSGDFEGVALARDRILQIVAEKTGREAVQIEMDGPGARFLWMSSVSGLSEAALKEQFPAVKCTLHRSFFTGSASHLSLSGDREQIAQLKSVIEETLSHLNSILKCASTPIPKQLLRFICGTKMSKLLEFEAQSNCALSLPPAESDSETVSICAPQQFLTAGLAALIKFTKSVDFKEISVPSEAVCVLFTRSAKHRAELKAAERETGASVLFLSEKRTICIEGLKEAVEAASSAVSALLTDLAARFSALETLSLDRAHVKHVIGKKGHVLQQIQKDFAVELMFDEAEEGKLLIAGKATGIEAAKAYIDKLISSVADLITFTAKIDHKFHAMLIGAKGANLAAYQERFPSVSVNFPQDAACNDVEFRGIKEEAEAFRAELVAQAEAIRHEQIMNSYVQDISNLRTRSSQDRAHLINFARLQGVKLHFSDHDAAQVQGNKKAVDAAVPLIEAEAALLADRDSLTFSVEAQFHPVLIGKGGRNLKHLQAKYGVNFQFPKDEKDATEITATGPRANLSKARDELLDLLQFHLENSHQETLTVPSKFLGSVLGRGGSRLTGIEVASDCRISFDRSQGDVKFMISGSKDGIKAAKAEIESIISEQERIKEISVECPAELFSTYNFAFRKLTAAHEKCKFFPHAAKVNIRGDCEAVNAAQSALAALLSSLAAFKTAALPDFPASAHGKLMGRGGENVKRLSAEHGVEIRVPRVGQVGGVQVIGPSEAVDAVIEEISKLH